MIRHLDAILDEIYKELEIQRHLYDYLPTIDTIIEDGGDLEEMTKAFRALHKEIRTVTSDMFALCPKDTIFLCRFKKENP